MLNSDSERVLLDGLRLFARQIRREHGLLTADGNQEEGGGGEKRSEAAAEDAGDEMAMVTSMVVDSDSGGIGSGSEGEEEKVEGGGKGEEPAAGYREALLEAADKGEAPGLLGEYLRGSPQLNDLLRLWDLDERKVGWLAAYRLWPSITHSVLFGWRHTDSGRWSATYSVCSFPLLGRSFGVFQVWVVWHASLALCV